MSRSPWYQPLPAAFVAAAMVAAIGCGSSTTDRPSSASAPATAETERPAQTPATAAEVPPSQSQAADSSRPAPEGDGGRPRSSPPPTTRQTTQPPVARETAPVQSAVPPIERPAPPPASIVKTIPAGTELAAIVESGASSQTSQVGQPVQARLAEDLSMDGRVVVPSGSILEGEVVAVVPQKKIGGTAKLSLEFSKLRLPSGEVVALAAGFTQEGKSQTKKDAATIGGSAAGGALLGKILGGSTKDAAIGAVVGAAAGSAVAANNKGDAVELPSGTQIKVRLEQPAEVTLR